MGRSFVSRASGTGAAGLGTTVVVDSRLVAAITGRASGSQEGGGSG